MPEYPASFCADFCSGLRAEIDAKCIAKTESIRYGFDETLIKQSGNPDKTFRKYGKKIIVKRVRKAGLKRWKGGSKP